MDYVAASRHMNPYRIVAMTNTILVSQNMGIFIHPGNTATLEATLWGDGAWANGVDWGGDGRIITGTVNIWDDPAFVDPDAGNYHIGLASADIDKGMDAGVDDDIDGDPRPQGGGYDIGADETGLAVTKQADPDSVQAGVQLTYTVRIANTSHVDLYATITDTLPTHITSGETSGGTVILPGGQITWTSVITAPGGIWTETVVVTVEMGCAGPLTNVVQVTTDQGVTGIYTAVTEIINLPPIANAGPDQFVVPSDAVLLDGSSSTDPDGHLPLTYRWRRTGGPFVILVDADKAQAAFQAPPYQSVLTFTLTVTDALGLGSNPDEVVVYVGIEPLPNQPPYTPYNPTPHSGATNAPLTQTLSWQGGDPDPNDTVTYTVALGISDPPPIRTTTTLTSYTPAGLIPNTTYYWTVTATDSISVTVGDTWSFSTVSVKYVYLPLVLRGY